MDLNTLWFILVGVLYIGFFILEGFDFGVGMLLPFLGKDDLRRRVIINTIGPHWDGNEVWLLTAGGATINLSPAGVTIMGATINCVGATNIPLLTAAGTINGHP